MSEAGRKTTTLRRTYRGTVDDLWELWTTVPGIESWWGPPGFSVKVRSLDLRPGGTLLYAMTAIAAPQIEFMKRAGMPITTETRILFHEVQPPTRLAYTNVVDFVPGVPSYHVGTVLELSALGDTVKLTLTIEAMHDHEWTQRAVMGWELELGKLEALLNSRR